MLTALASPVRREILGLIWDQELAAGEIAAAFSVTKPTISQHLAVLREAGLATSRAIGTSRRYRARQEALRGLRAAVSGPGKWLNADDVPERALSDTTTRPAVIASTDVPTDQVTTFAAVTDPVIYSRWLGVPVTIENGRFACTMEWGTVVRGRYELVCPPELIVMSWDFEDENIPLPGGEMTGYLWVTPRAGGAHVEVHQITDSAAQAEFMRGAWGMVLGRLNAGIVQAVDRRSRMEPRPGRRKHTTLVRLLPVRTSLPAGTPRAMRTGHMRLSVAARHGSGRQHVRTGYREDKPAVSGCFRYTPRKVFTVPASRAAPGRRAGCSGPGGRGFALPRYTPRPVISGLIRARCVPKERKVPRNRRRAGSGIR